MAIEKKLWQYNFSNEKGEGWGVIFIREDGIFTALSDYGNYGYFWSHHGCDDFREFFLKADEWYLLNKLSPRRELDEEKSFAAVREFLRNERRTGGLTKNEARRLWDELEDYSDDWQGFIRSDFAVEICDEPWNFQVMEHATDAVAFVKKLVKGRLVPVLREQLRAEKKS